MKFDGFAHSEFPCWCPICNWNGFLWAYVGNGPQSARRKLCPRCESYPRDRILWCFLNHLKTCKVGRPLSVLEIGGAARSYWWKKRLFTYLNADTTAMASETVDLTVKRGLIVNSPSEMDTAVLSFVLGEVTSLAVRVVLLQQLYAATTSDGILILFDDICLDAETHRRASKRKFFHKLRLGRRLLDELAVAGWKPQLIENIPENRILGESDVPFVIAYKRSEGFPRLVESLRVA